jgi:seryl-tRNA synthetase
MASGCLYYRDQANAATGEINIIYNEVERINRLIEQSNQQSKEIQELDDCNLSLRRQLTEEKEKHNAEVRRFQDEKARGETKLQQTTQKLHLEIQEREQQYQELEAKYEEKASELAREIQARSRLQVEAVSVSESISFRTFIVWPRIGSKTTLSVLMTKSTTAPRAAHIMYL